MSSFPSGGYQLTNGPAQTSGSSGRDEGSEPVGVVLGTEPSTPLDFWVAVPKTSYLQLDDPVFVTTAVAGRGDVRVSGLVAEVRARHEGLSFDSDAFLVDRGIIPSETAVAARVVATRFDPELFVPPMPGVQAFRARGADRDRAMFHDAISRRIAAGLSRDGEPIYLDLDFIDGTRGAHVNISGISGVATKTTYALYVLYALFHSEQLGLEAVNTKAVVFNVKGEDLMWLDRPNARLTREAEDDYARLSLPARPFASVGLWAPTRDANRGVALPAVEGRNEGVSAFYWTVREFVRNRYLRFMFAEAEDERSQIADLVARVEHMLDTECPDDPDSPACVIHRGRVIESFDFLCDLIHEQLDDDQSRWRGRLSDSTIAAFQRRLASGRQYVAPLIWGRAADEPARHRLDFDARQVTVIDIHALHDRGKRFVTGVVLKRLFEEKERMGRRQPLHFVVLDELNRYAPRAGRGPIKDVLLDIAERGRSLGIVLIGAEQTASEVEDRVVANSAVRVVGRLDSAEAAKSEYGFMPAITRARATILKPGSMIVQQPHIPVPYQLRFPFPCWATRAEEGVLASREDVFARFDRA